MPEAERPREKMRMFGVERLSNSELLAVLIGTGTRNVSATAVAENILSMDQDGLAHLSGCTVEELAAINGVGTAKSSQIVAAVELGRRIATRPKKKLVYIGSPKEIADLFMEDMRHLRKECLKILFLNIKNEIMALEGITIGNINTSIIDPREVFRPAIKRGAASVVLAHNHPSGNPEPSESDISMTKRLMEAGELLGVLVLDHIIIGDGVFVSLRNEKAL
jgi:DNA repair protein RadC